MNILYLLRYYPTLTETFVYEEITGLVEGNKATISIVSLGERSDGLLLEEPPKASQIIGLPKNRWGRWRQPKGPGAIWLSKHQRAKDVARLSALIDIAKVHDHLHVHFAGEAAEMAHAVYLETGISYSVTVHAVDLFNPRPSLIKVLKSASHVATISKYNQERLRKMGVDSQLVRCGVDMEKWEASPLPNGPIKALFIGRDTEKKGLDWLLSQWTHLDKKHALTVIGDEKKRSTPNNIKMLGRQARHVVIQEMRKSNLFVLPCTTAKNGDQDGIPVVLMEAMACGRPVISTAISGIPELVTPETGWLIQNLSEIDLKNALLDAMNHNTRLKKGRMGRMRLKEIKCTKKDHTQEMATFFVKVV